MKVLTIDTETTISNNGNPFDKTNSLVLLGLKHTNYKPLFFGPKEVELAQEYIDKADWLVLFNAKFDLHWLKRVGLSFKGKKIWDCQLAEFILSHQKTSYPNLNDTSIKYGGNPKLDIVKTEYWDKGIDTDQIPMDILKAYLKGDLEETEKVFLAQLEAFKSNNLYPLFKLQCMDLLVLQEMEWNGIVFNTEKALEHAKNLQKELDELNRKFTELVGNIPINLNSNDHISALLYGGTITEDTRIPVGVYKTGAKIGQTRYKVETKEYILPRLMEPLKGSETAKEGYWKVNDDVLKQLKPDKKGKELLSLLATQSKLEKLKGTYLEGWSKLIDKMNWEHNMIHGTLNQCVVVTGRLASSKPNLQNADPITKVYCESRYP